MNKKIVSKKKGLVNKLYRTKYFPLLFQLITLISLFLLIFGALGITTTSAPFAKILRNTNLSNLIVWSFWWPAIIFTAVIFGRHWCTICPIELITAIFSKIGLKYKPNKFLKSGWSVTIFYIIILFGGINIFAIHRIPNLMAIYLLILLFISIAISLIWEKRAFCSYLCPVGNLLGLYSLLSLTTLGRKERAICQSCKTKECISDDKSYLLIGRSCTSNIHPLQNNDRSDCILCTQCVSVCPKDNISLQRRKSFSHFINLELNGSQIVFLLIVSGFVVYEVLSIWSIPKSYLTYIPNIVAKTFSLSGWIKSLSKPIILFIVFPSMFFLLFSLMLKKISNYSFQKSLMELSIAVLPIMGCMHVVKAMLKSTSRIPYIEHALSDYRGVKTATLIQKGTIVLDKSIPNLISPLLTSLSIIIPVIAITLSIWIIRKRNTNLYAKIILSIATFLYFSLFEISMLIWMI